MKEIETKKINNLDTEVENKVIKKQLTPKERAVEILDAYGYTKPPIRPT